MQWGILIRIIGSEEFHLIPSWHLADNYNYMNIITITTITCWDKLHLQSQPINLHESMGMNNIWDFWRNLKDHKSMKSSSWTAIQFIHISICFHWHMARHQLCIIIIIIIIITTIYLTFFHTKIGLDVCPRVNNQPSGVLYKNKLDHSSMPRNNATSSKNKKY